jgi:hypothetical protein
MTTAEALDLLRTNTAEELAKDMQSTRTLLELLANLPLAIKQASAYMDDTAASNPRRKQYKEASNRAVSIGNLLAQEGYCPAVWGEVVVYLLERPRASSPPPPVSTACAVPPRLGTCRLVCAASTLIHSGKRHGGPGADVTTISKRGTL